MIRIGNYLYLFIITLIISSQICSAQQTGQQSSNKNIWFTASRGIMYATESAGNFTDFSFEYLGEESILSFQYFIFSSFKRDFLTYFFVGPEWHDFQGGSILYGMVQRFSSSKKTISIGVSLMKHTTEMENIEKSKYIVGLPISAQYVLTPVLSIAIGVRAYANINKENIIFGAGVAVYLGSVH